MDLAPSFSMALMVTGYLTLLAVLEMVLPGKRIPGALLSDGTRLHYKCNGLSSLAVLIVIIPMCISPKELADRGGELFTTTLTICILMSLVLYVTGYYSRSKTASLKPHVTGNFIHDWWFGVQLNPQVLGLDVKFFWCKAGMISLFVINTMVAIKQSHRDGKLSLPMKLYQTFCNFYVVDYLWHEEYMTSTWDIIAENFGFMLVFGDMVWIPFAFSIQAWWLLYNDVDLTVAAVVLNVIVFLAGYTIFRGANKQKHVFKKDPTATIWGKPPVLIGGKLLVSGYWGISRHCNYLGDILLALSFSLPCGTSSIVPYFYPIYLFILLIWRERRDEARCREKYKDVWVEYCKAVPWRIFPRIY